MAGEEGPTRIQDMGSTVLEALGDGRSAKAVGCAYLLGRLAGTADALSEALAGPSDNPEARDALLLAAWENAGLIDAIESSVRGLSSKWQGSEGSA